MDWHSLIKNKWVVRTADILLVAVIITVVILGYVKYSKPDTIFTGQLSRHEVQAALVSDYMASTAHPDFKVNSPRRLVRAASDNVKEILSRTKFFSGILASNRMDRIGLSTVACSSEDGCGITNEGYQYPVPINQKDLMRIQKEVPLTGYPDVIIIDVRSEEEYLESHIPGSINLSMTELVEIVFPMNRWSTFIVVGNTYEQTRIASEAMYRLLFHYIYRFQYPYRYWDGETETFLADGH